MKKACLPFLIAFVVFFAAYYWFLQSRFEGGALLVLSLLGSVALLLFVSGVVGLFTSGSDKAVLQKSMRMTSPQDGKKIAASGIIQPAGLNLCKSPISDEDCVLYEYKMRTQTQEGDPAEYSGFGMSSCVIRSSFGDMRLLSFPVLDAFPWEGGNESDVPSSAQEYIRNTRFEEVGLKDVFQLFQEIFTDEDGVLKKDLYRKLNRQEYNGPSVQQRIVRPGAEVCALGKYSSKQNGLIGDMGFKAAVNRLYPGNVASVSKNIGREFGVTFKFGLIFFLLLHAMLFVMYKFRYTNATPRDQSFDLQYAIQEHQLEQVEKMLNGGVDVNLRDSSGKTPLLINYQDPDVVALLIKHHADLEARDPQWDETVLFKVAREGRPEVLKLLIQAGANVNAVSKIPSPHTALADAVSAERPEIEKMLIGAGATDVRVTAATGEPITLNDDVVETFQAYMDAIYSKDIDTMMRLTRNTDRKNYDTADFGLWQSVRIRRPDSVSGFKNQKAATLRVAGAMPDGSQTAWWYQMEKTDEGTWVIDREWWETKQ